MSISTYSNPTPGFRPELGEMSAPFTSFRSGQFVKPAPSVQPVVEQLTSFAGAFTDLYCVAGLDLDYDEPNVIADMQFVVAGNAVQCLQLPVEGLVR